MTLAEIQQRVLASRGGIHGSWPWTQRMLARADEQFGGVWRAVMMPSRTALDVILPPHAGEPCRGDQLTLVEPSGATVEAAAATLAGLGDMYARRNPSCGSRLAAAGDAGFSDVVLTPAPLDWEEYAGVAPVAGAYYCVDGFHRLVAWAAAGRIGPGTVIPALMAGSAGSASGLEYVPAHQTGR